MMKKITLFIIAAALGSLSANAQEKFTYGIKGGINTATITNCEHDLAVVKYTRSFNVGVFAEWRLNRLFALAPELIYSRQGAKATILTFVYMPFSTGYPIKVKSDLRLGYINIPVMAKIYPSEWFSIDVGPQAGILLSAKTKTRVPDNRYFSIDGSNSGTSDSKHEVNTFDLSLAVGFTCDIAKGIFLQARYTIGMTEAYKKERYDYMNRLDDKISRNQVYTLGLGYRF